jgi:hypothetical protein
MAFCDSHDFRGASEASELFGTTDLHEDERGIGDEWQLKKK